MTLEKYAMIERERMEGAKTVQSKTVDAANETRGHPPGKCQRETASNTINQSTKRKVRKIMEKMFLRVSDVEEILGVSESYAYKLIRKLNKEMQDLGFQTIQGRIDTKFFYEHFYQTQNYERRDA